MTYVNATFECRRLPIFKWAHIQGKLKPIVKTPSLYHVWFQRSSLDKLSTKLQNGRHIGFSINMKMTQNQFVHLEDRVYQILFKSDLFEKIVNYDVMAAILETLWKPK